MNRDVETGQSSLQVIDINKRFGSSQVLFDVSIMFKAKSVHAIVGENGAGKSTLMKIIAGIYAKDRGEIRIDNQILNIHSPRQSQEQGIMLMHQELSMFPEMSVAENIFAGHMPRHGIFKLVDWKRLYQASDKILSELECGLSSKQKVKNLSVANQHICEFARFLSMKSKYIILDEPTAALSEREKEIIFKFIRQLKEDYNLGILYISHRMHEIYEIADEVSVLRDGVMQGTFGINDIKEEELTRLMVGHDVGKVHRKESNIDYNIPPVLEVCNLSYKGSFNDVNFTIRRGEVLGLAGLLGAKRTEIADAIFGAVKSSSGNIKINGNTLNSHSVKRAVDSRIALVPEDRKIQGLILSMSCMHNMTISILKRVESHGIISNKKEVGIYDQYSKELSIKASSYKQKASELSGGNQQKIVLSKWLSLNPSVLILNEPTRGIDVGAKAEIYKLIQELSDRGYAILLITSDMFELLTLSSRILTVYDGTITAELIGEQMTEDIVIRAISKHRERT